MNTQNITSKNTKYLKKYKVLILIMSVLRYTNYCTDCEQDFKSDMSWKTLCKPCYMLKTYPDKYKTCPECNTVQLMRDYPRCFECNKKHKVEREQQFEKFIDE